MSENILRLSGFYQMHFGNWFIKLGESIESRKLDSADSETDARVFSDIKYRIN
jgi:hypothetical protein